MEMIIVMTVIALLLLLTVPRIQHVFLIIANKGCDAQLKIIDSAILQYMLDKDKTPTSMFQLESEGLISRSQFTCQNGKEITIVNGEASYE